MRVFWNTAQEIADTDMWEGDAIASRTWHSCLGSRPYIYAGYEVAARAADEAGVTFEAVYDLSDLENYQIIYVPPNQTPLSASQIIGLRLAWRSRDNGNRRRIP